MGALGAVLMAVARKRLSMGLLKQAMDSTTKLSCFVLYILIGSSVFGLTFRGVDGDLWVEHLMTSLPGGQTGFLIAVNLLVFVLAFFLDYFELAFILVPLLAPVAEKLGIDLVWFGVLLAVNMQTSFMHPPFGFALFYLKSVAPKSVTSGDIYRGAIPFVIIQIGMVATLMAFPGLASYRDAAKAHDGIRIDAELVPRQLPDDARRALDVALVHRGGHGHQQRLVLVGCGRRIVALRILFGDEGGREIAGSEARMT